MNSTMDDVTTCNMAAEEFAAWVREKGGDERFIRVLASFGFSSKLSLGKCKYGIGSLLV